MTDANFTNGEKRYASSFDCEVQSSDNGSDWTDEYDVPTPGSTGTWESWSRNESLTGTYKKYVAVEIEHHGGSDIEFADCAIAIYSSGAPTVTVGDEQEMAIIDCVIENSATGESIETGL